MRGSTVRRYLYWLGFLICNFCCIIVDVIMDMLGKPKLRKSILEYYETLDEPNQVRKAVEKGIIQKEGSRTTKSLAIFTVFNNYYCFLPA